MDILEVHNEVLNQKYLGMPTDVGVATIGAFKYLKDSVEQGPGMDGAMSIDRG
jgi:hypothetical protein